VKNLSNDNFGMCPICNRAKWSHTNEHEISCTEDMLKVNTIKNVKEQLEQLKIKLKHTKKKIK
jgi:hypothetical protein